MGYKEQEILGFVVGAILGTLAGLYLGAHFFPESSQGVRESFIANEHRNTTP